MTVTHLFAGLPGSDLDCALAFYEALLGHEVGLGGAS